MSESVLSSEVADRAVGLERFQAIGLLYGLCRALEMARKFSPACLAPKMGRSSPNRVNHFGPTDLTVGSK